MDRKIYETITRTHTASANSNANENANDINLTGGFANSTLLLISLFGFTLLLAFLALLCHLSPHHNGEGHGHGEEKEESYEEMLVKADVNSLTRSQRRARAKLVMKKNRRAVAAAAVAAVPVPAAVAMAAAGDGNMIEVEGQGDANNAPENIENNDAPNHLKLTRKERRKAAKELERIERQASESQRQAQQKYEHELQMIQRQEKEEKKQTLILERKKKEERDVLEYTYLFPYSQDGDGEGEVEVEGEVENLDENENEENLRLRYGITAEEYITEVQHSPIIDLETTSARFHVSIPKLIQRLQQLQKEGRILPHGHSHGHGHGILKEEHNVYFVITEEIMEQVAILIEEKGKLTLEELGDELYRMLLVLKTKTVGMDEKEDIED